MCWPQKGKCVHAGLANPVLGIHPVPRSQNVCHMTRMIVQNYPALCIWARAAPVHRLQGTPKMTRAAFINQLLKRGTSKGGQRLQGAPIMSTVA
eukprot:1160450-Pelagomonas_calceolata.AAC.12